MVVQRFRDLSVRSETSRDITARNLGHIHNYVYKLRGLLAKTSDWTRSRESIRSRGFSRRDARDKNRFGKSPFLREFRAKPVVLFLWIQTEQRQGPFDGH
jgi:hypothetical protein